MAPFSPQSKTGWPTFTPKRTLASKECQGNQSAATHEASSAETCPFPAVTCLWLPEIGCLPSVCPNPEESSKRNTKMNILWILVIDRS